MMDLRWGHEGDHDRIVALLHLMHSEVGAFPISMRKVTANVARLLRDGRVLLASDEGRLVGSIGLIGEELWYSDEKIIGDNWIFARSDVTGRLSIFRAMVAEVRKYAQAAGMPLVLTLFSAKDARRKGDLFARYGDEIMRGFQFMPVGGEYRVN